ncbi:hypothetical protein EPD60_09555 [Flaviaesturariibacter flavus]|uniref:SusF/SusE family outer membrane protein n=1 Tax=Flaviaesturariibacter flavus TaxID=2502780 RepID=A0A4R1BB70_9BACT|nr:hypothetical protein [Flaviaesturariibacter flavus]TCJ14241.1 hypothetical protein EPD60_09555 [Flaviaesturariibacter flavus]
MKKYSRYTAPVLMALAACLGIVACKYDVKELAPAPTADFTITPLPSLSNYYRVEITGISNANQFQWETRYSQDPARNKKMALYTKTVDTLFIPLRGVYDVSLIAYGPGGSKVVTKSLNVPQDVPLKQVLTGNSTKTWILDQPGGGALWVGDPGGAQWWSNGAADVNAPDRTCLFNDEYTFKMDGSFIFDDKGDLRVDDEANAPFPADMAGPGTNIGCYPASAIQPQYRPWGSGNFTFQIIGANQLKVIGTGAHLGLYKAGQNGTINMPEAENTYEIVELTSSKLVVRKMYGWGQWKFTFKPKP